MYADHFPPFDVAPLSTYAPERFVEMIEYAEENGYEVLVLDTLSHEWMGEGGILDLVDRRIAATRNKEGAWKEASALHEALFERIYASHIDVIACFRAKQQVVLDKDQEGKLTVKRFGVGAVAREGWESDFDVACDIQPEGHRLSVVMSHFPGLTGLVVEKPGFEFAQTLLKAVALSGAHANASDLEGVETAPHVARANVAGTPADPIEPGAVGLVAA
jgi:hypothetical protein